jgi:hypothetical protein
MKGKLVLNIGVFLLAVLYWVNLGAFVVIDVSNEYVEMTNGYPGSLAIGDALSWASAAVSQTGTGIGPILGLAIFAIIASIFLKSYNKKRKVWKKVVIIISDFFILLFAFFQLMALLMVPGKKYAGPMVYMFSYGTTGTFYILFLAALLVFVGAIMLIVEGFQLSNQMNGSAKDEQLLN